MFTPIPVKKNPVICTNLHLEKDLNGKDFYYST